MLRRVCGVLVRMFLNRYVILTDQELDTVTLSKVLKGFYKKARVKRAVHLISETSGVEVDSFRPNDQTLVDALRGSWPNV